MSSLVPMFALTGKPKKEDLKKKFQGFKNRGVDEIMLYARSGCELAYMSQEWLTCCENCMVLAEEVGIKLWIYDEFNWPSGSCDGRVARLSKDFCAKYLDIENEKVVIRYKNPNQTVKDDGSLKSSTPFSVDILNPNATDAFINLTHEAYKKRFKKYFGNVILGFFTDEPSFAYCSSKENPPYYEGVWEDYAKRYSRNGESDFLSGEEGFYSRYISLIGERFAQAYLKRINDWCQANGLIFTGHLFLDSGIKDSIRANGEILPALEEFGLPGVDKITNRVNASKDFLFSYATYLRKNGKSDVMSEMFALGPCSLPYARKRQMIWYSALYGVSKYFVAISHFDLRGNRLKVDYFHDFSPSAVDFAGAEELEKSAKLASFYASKKPIEEIVIKYPYKLLAQEYDTNEKKIDGVLLGLIEKIIEGQYTFVIDKEENPKHGAVCIKFKNNGLLEENSGKTFGYDLADLMEYIQSKIERKVEVLSQDGTLASNILLRKYQDGTFAVLDRNVNAVGGRNILIKTQEKVEQVYFCDYGLYLSDAVYGENLGSNIDVKNLSYFASNDNFYRPHFIGSSVDSLYANEDMEVAFYKIAKDNKVFLNGKEIDFCEKADNLPDTMSDLYVKSKKILIKKGINNIETDGLSYPFLPFVLISGNFNINNNELSSRNNDSLLGKRFFGCAGVKFDIEIPQNRSALIKFNANNLVSEVYVDGDYI